MYFVHVYIKKKNSKKNFKISKFFSKKREKNFQMKKVFGLGALSP